MAQLLHFCAACDNVDHDILLSRLMGWKGSNLTLHLPCSIRERRIGGSDQYQYLGNCPPAPPLTQQQSIDNKLGLMLG